MLSINLISVLLLRFKRLAQLCFKLLLVSLHISTSGSTGRDKRLRSPLPSLLLSLLSSLALIAVIIFMLYWLLVVFLG